MPVWEMMSSLLHAAQHAMLRFESTGPRKLARRDAALFLTATKFPAEGFARKRICKRLAGPIYLSVGKALLLAGLAMQCL